MCGRFANAMPVDLMRELFGTTGPLPNWEPSWNIAPSQKAPIVRLRHETGQCHLDLLQWGLIPHWSKEVGRQPINARAETVASSPMFRSAFAARRALVPASAYYEWQRGSSPKQPWAFRHKGGGAIALAGLWESWEHEGELIRTFLIITTQADALMRPIHDRMPVAVRQADWPLWLGGETRDAQALLRPETSDTLECYPVSAVVNSVRNDGPQLLERDESARSLR
ncbi:SOS response-associated peptidase [Acetobacter conturbans]|uniref:Abasic site processing protein n=1 Tax=Acetobacter conturbans TaxID=1737472 RepID=A0ABX0JXM0_9PROT|nr:SOS response-associated peptidase [Acetobacter conturbans]NHN87190.1 SOS response-associated peptidase [Acetobacter conturbans]